MSNSIGFWQKFKRPSSKALGTLLVIGFVLGIGFWGGFNTVLEMTNTEAFCIGCHEMEENVYQEYQETIHFTNRSGVRATCPDCHVPKEWTHKIVRKIKASKEIWGKITGIIDTPEKFEEHRKEMAMREWARMKANDSRECRNCHDFEYMDFSRQTEQSSERHDAGFENNETCIDCHKGIAHELPDMTGVPGWEQ